MTDWWKNEPDGIDEDYDYKITIQHDLPFIGSEKPIEATYYLCDRIPIRELFDTHKENYSITSGSISFYYNGALINPSTTPYDLKMKIDRVENIVIMKGFERERFYRLLNQIGNALQSTITNERLKEIQPGPFHEDMLNYIFSYLSLKDLISTTNVCVYWHMVTQKLSLLTQMDESDFAWIERQRYPEWLDEVSEISWKIMISNQENKKMSEMWDHSNVRQSNRKWWWTERNGRCSISKGMGCRMIKSVKFVEGQSKPDQSLELFKIRNEFFSHFKPKDEPKPQTFRSFVDFFNRKKSKTINTSSVDYKNFKNLQIVEINDDYPKLQKKCIEMFSEYFSPEIKYLFPLVVFKQKKDCLNFNDTITWMIFGGDEDVIPFGACSFRLLKKTFESKKVQNVCEVLFIGVWEKLRNQRYGSALVENIEKYAKDNGCGIFYVEISEDQPLAKDFWKLNGFQELVDSKLATEQQIRFFNNNCLRFTDTTQFVKSI